MMQGLKPQIQKALQIYSRISIQKEIHKEIDHSKSAKLQRQRGEVTKVQRTDSDRLILSL